MKPHRSSLSCRCVKLSYCKSDLKALSSPSNIIFQCKLDAAYKLSFFNPVSAILVVAEGQLLTGSRILLHSLTARTSVKASVNIRQWCWPFAISLIRVRKRSCRSDSIGYCMITTFDIRSHSLTYLTWIWLRLHNTDPPTYIFNNHIHTVKAFLWVIF